LQVNKSVLDNTKNIVLLEITGRIKSGYLSVLEHEIKHVSEKRPVLLILNLGGIEAVDSSGLGLLIKARNEILQTDGNVVLMAGSRVQTVIKLAGLENYFKIAATQEEAIQLVQQPPEPAVVPPETDSEENAG
jgi:Anti-anti-sigma regulatory factor (antagonist of anti-sigma factor)